MKKITTLFTLLWLGATTIFAQDVTEADQTAALEYINNSQILLNNINQVMLSQQQINLSPNLSKEAKQKALEQNAAQISPIVEQLKGLPKLKHDEGLHETVLNYSDALVKIMNKDKNGFYTKTAAQNTGCENCIKTLEGAYRLQQNDYTNADLLYDKLWAAFDRVAEKHLIEWDESDDPNEVVYKIREATDFVHIMGLGVNRGIITYNGMAMDMQAALQKRKTVEELEKVQKKYHKDFVEASEFLESLEQKDRVFEGDDSMWKACEAFFDKMKVVDEDCFPRLIEFSKQKEAGTEADKKEVENIIKQFSEVGEAVKKYQAVQATFLNKYYEMAK